RISPTRSSGVWMEPPPRRRPSPDRTRRPSIVQVDSQAKPAEILQLRIADIMRILPHRYPFLLVDRIVEVERDQRIVGLKNVTINEPFFAGHFPGAPVMPGVLTIECMAQAGAILGLIDEPDLKNSLVYF